MKRLVTAFILMTVGLFLLFTLTACDKNVEQNVEQNDPDGIDYSIEPIQKAQEQNGSDAMVSDEKSSWDLIFLRGWYFTSGAPNNIIEFSENHKEYAFDCVTYGGVLKGKGEPKKELTASPGDRLYWEADKPLSKTYITIVIKSSDDCIGYSVIEIRQNEETGIYGAEMLKCVCFVGERVEEKEVYQRINIEIERSMGYRSEKPTAEEEAHRIVHIENEDVCGDVDLTEMDKDYVYSYDGNELVILSYIGKDKKAIVPAGVSKIAEKAFAGAYVEEISLPGTVKEVARDAFSNVVGVKKATVTADVLGLLGKQPSLEWLNITYDRRGDNDLSAINFKTFENLKEVYLSVPLCEGVFADCYRLQKVYIGSSCTAIPDRAFENCTKLTDVSIGSVHSI